MQESFPVIETKTFLATRKIGARIKAIRSSNYIGERLIIPMKQQAESLFDAHFDAARQLAARLNWNLEVNELIGGRRPDDRGFVFLLIPKQSA